MGKQEAGDIIAKIANWIAFVSSILCFIVFGFRLIGSNASLEFCNGFISDACNAARWRGACFSFAPSVFVDTWTPFCFGFVGLFLHFKYESFKVKPLLKNWMYFFVFHFCMAMFGMLGYANGVGIMLGSVCLVGNLFQLLAIFLSKDYPPGLDLDLKLQIKCKSSEKGNNTFATVTSWIAFVSSCLVIVVGVFRIIASGAHLDWCDKFIDDVCNKGDWRLRLFSFVPDVFVDVWTPMVMGIMGVCFHFKSSPFKLTMFSSNWLRFFAYHLAMCLFGSLGYSNGVGIIIGSIVALAALLSFIAIFICEQHPCLDLNFNIKWNLSGSGANTGGSAQS